MHDPQPRRELADVPDLLAVVPHLLGFHPGDSGVVVGVRDQRIHVVARLDLPGTDAQDPTPPVPADETAAVLHDIAAECAAHGVTDLVVLGYGDETPVLALFDMATAVFTVRGLTVMHLVRVTGARYVEHDCHEPRSAGDPTLFDSGARPGLSVPGPAHRPAPDRATLAARVAPLHGGAAKAMAEAIETAAARLGVAARRTRPQSPPPPSAAAGSDAVGDDLVRLGCTAVDAAVRVSERGGTLDDAAAAELIVLLRSVDVRDHAFAYTDGDQRHLRLWLDLTRRAQPAFVASPACLAAYTAWRTRQPTLALFAADRALRDDPGNRLAALIQVAVSLGMPPELADQVAEQLRATDAQE